MFTLDQAKQVNDTFVSQKKEIERLKNIKPIIRIDTVDKIVYVKGENKEGFTFYEGVVFMFIQAIIMIPTIFPMVVVLN